MAKNEAELCEIVVRKLEEALGVSRGRMTRPEVDGSGPPVDLRVELGDARYALEHTLIEPFEGAIEFASEFGELINEVVEALDRSMPHPGLYVLTFPLHPTDGRHRRTHAELRSAIINWTRAAADDLYDQMPERRSRDHLPHGFEETVRGEVLGLELSLRRRVHWSDNAKHDGRLFVQRTVGDDIEARRRSRIAVALDRKLGKLAACALAGDCTVLILEYDDIALSHQVLIARALQHELSERTNVPEQIILAETGVDERQWHLFQPVIDGRFSIDMEAIEVERVRPEVLQRA